MQLLSQFSLVYCERRRRWSLNQELMTRRRKTGKNCKDAFNNGLGRERQALPPEAGSENIHRLVTHCSTPESVENGYQRLASVPAVHRKHQTHILPPYGATSIKLHVNNRRNPFVGIRPPLHYPST
jgi:hypothetical protein